MRQDSRPDFANTGFLPKAALFMAATSAILSLCSWFTLSAALGDAIYPLHIAMILLMVIGFIRAGWQSFVEIFRREDKAAATPLPAVFRWCFVASLIYFIAVFGGYAALSQPGATLDAAAGLRIASSAYLFLSLCLFALAHRLERQA